MKTAAAVIASAVLMFGATRASAQADARTQTQRVSLPESSTPRAAEEHPSMSFAEVKSITETSLRTAISEQLEGITSDEVIEHLSSSFDALERGQEVNFTTPVSGLSGHSITEQYSMNVMVHYEPRPIGGILSVKVELVPLFCGIGSASRPAAYRELSQAIDNLDDDALGQTVSSLTHDLGEEYATR